MVLILKPQAEKQNVKKLVSEIEGLGLGVMVNEGTQCVVLGLLGDTSMISPEKLQLNPIVERVMRVQEPFKKASRKFHPDSTVVNVGTAKIGAEFSVIAGPCSVESKEQIIGIAKSVKASGAKLLRGGAFKPRTSPYAFQGLLEKGIELLIEAKKETGLPIVSEIMSPKHIDLFAEHVDVIQVGARNMQNFDLLRELGGIKKPILLKRGLSATIEEWLMSAEYLLAGENNDVILCERGIRTFETYTRNTLDLSAVLAARKISHLPVIVDPSHACGLSWMVPSLAMAAAAVAADGLIIEVHNDPKNALCDGPQSLDPKEFQHLMERLSIITAEL